MKASWSVYFLLAFLDFGIHEKAIAQDTGILQLVNGKRYVFIAQSASPLGAGTMQLTSMYTFAVMPDSIISDLPYFGQVYQPSMSSSDTGMKFTSLNFTYSTKEKKKGGWEIKIKTKDVRNSPIIYISITTSGYAMVRISSYDRQAISYNGRIEEFRKK